jgi:hypothetical protein
MKGDFSRHTFNRKKHYTRVLMQQGRVQADADWNEQQAIHQHRVETEARDVIGPCGAPMDNDGFKITVQADNSLLIGKGRFYVDGILCENDADAGVPYDRQPYLLNATPPDVLTLLNDNKTLWAIIYLDVWQRHITALDDPHIREVALGGPDTATRAQNVWQVKILPVALATEVLQLRTKLAELLVELAKAERSHIAKATARVAELRKEIDTINQELARFSSQITCISKSDEWDKLIAASTGTLNARTQPLEDPHDPCLIPPSAGYQRLENQLYRVEIHLGSDKRGGPTFKWSRENGSVVTTIEGFSGSDVNVHDVGPDDVLGFAPGQWVEIIDEDKELKGLPGELVRISSVAPASRVITMETAPTVVDQSLHPKLRRWEQLGPLATPADVKNGVKITNDWQDLEGGIQVMFSAGTYKTGDYWLIPARTATGDIEWPPYAIPNTSPIAQPPLGIHHHYCRLGLLRLNPQNQQLYTQDCRERFPALASPAIHVIGINWKNDDLFSPEQLLSEGLKITLDAVPEQLSVNTATVIVTLELSAAMVLGRAGISNEFNLSLIINGTLTVESNVIHWTLQGRAGAAADETLLGKSSRSASSAAFAIENAILMRVRVTLKGHDIWSNQGNELYYLDGQAFGQLDVRSDGQTPRSALILPSGAGVLASDFESWFYLGEPPTPLRISTINFISALPGQPERPSSFTVDLSKIPATSTTPPQLPKVRFGDALPVNVIEVAFNRAIASGGIVANGQPQSITVTQEATSPTAGPSRVFGNIQFKPNTNNTVVRFVAEKPGAFGVASYTLTVFGTDHADVGPAIKAQDNGVVLDGDFDGKPGGDFILPFEVFISIT